MARMIPPQIPASAPRGERLVFDKIRNDPAARDWIVFHSFDIRRHVVRTEGEADLVVVIPGQGIVCIEVKGCGVSRNGGIWTYSYDPPRQSRVGPFRQAADAAHSLRTFLGGRDALLGRLVFHSAVIFTEIDFPEKSMEWEPWQVIDRTTLLRNPLSKVLAGVLDAAHAKLRGQRPVPGWYGEQSRPKARDVEALIALLRRDFEYVATAGLALQLTEESIRRFTEEQFHAIDLIEENPRLLFKGPAGTGKTLLAIEAARRAVRSGRSVCLVCFNSLLGSWLRQHSLDIAEEARTSGVSFRCGTISSLMLGITRMEVPLQADSAFWSGTLPARATDVLLSDGAPPAFDMLIADEAQDLLADPVLDVLELLTAGGLAAGRWAMFGDFERQAIYANSNAQPGLDRLRTRTDGSLTTYPLRINCRNTANIANAVTLTSGLAPGYSRTLADVDAPDVDPVFYRSPAHQREQLSSTLRRLLRKHPAGQIIVLSARADAAACAGSLGEAIDGTRVVAFRDEPDADTAAIRYSTVHAFKGLEAAAVVLTDIEAIDDDQSRSILYTGMTRARIALVVLMHERVRSPYDSLLMEGYKALGRKDRQ